MRILVLSTDHPPHRAGGYELQCAATVGHLRRHGHDVDILTSARRHAGRQSDDPAGVHRELHRFPAAPRRTPVWEAFAAERHNAATLARHLAAFRPDVVSLWRMAELSVSLIGRVARSGVPAVGMVCDPWPIQARVRDPWARRRSAALLPDLRRAARWLVVSHALRDELVAGGAAAFADARVVPPGIDVGALPPAPRRPWRGQLLYVGRLSPLKGVDTAVRALAALDDPAAQLDIVGDGPASYVAELRHLAGALGVGQRVHLRGPMPAARVASAYAAADAVLFPSRWNEPWGLVPLEAMARGTPVVATGTGGSGAYLRDGINALLAAPGHPAAFATAIRRLARDPALRDRLRTGGRHTAESHPQERSSAAVRRALEGAASVADQLPRTRPRRKAISRSA